MVLVLRIMIENFDPLFDDEKLFEKPRKSEVKAIEKPPDFLDMVSWFYSNKVIFPKEVSSEMLTVSNDCKLFYCGDEYIYALDLFTKSVRKVFLIGFE